MLELVIDFFHNLLMQKSHFAKLPEKPEPPQWMQENTEKIGKAIQKILNEEFAEKRDPQSGIFHMQVEHVFGIVEDSYSVIDADGKTLFKLGQFREEGAPVLRFRTEIVEL